jgi:hypothetical protein
MNQDLFEALWFWLLLTVMGCVGYAIGLIDWNRLAGRFTAWQLRRRFPLPTLPKITTEEGMCIAQQAMKDSLSTFRGKSRDEWPEVIE